MRLYMPEYKDLWFRQALMADAETMAYNRAWGGTIPFPEERWADWYEYWIVRPEGQRFYRYLQADSGEFVGEAAYHWDESLNGYGADVIVFAPYRGRGFGGRGLDLLCAAAKENGVTVLYDDLAIDNPAYGMFIRHGFAEERRTDEKIILKKRL